MRCFFKGVIKSEVISRADFSPLYKNTIHIYFTFNHIRFLRCVWDCLKNFHVIRTNQVEPVRPQTSFLCSRVDQELPQHQQN